MKKCYLCNQQVPVTVPQEIPVGEWGDCNGNITKSASLKLLVREQDSGGSLGVVAGTTACLKCYQIALTQASEAAKKEVEDEKLRVEFQLRDKISKLEDELKLLKGL